MLERIGKPEGGQAVVQIGVIGASSATTRDERNAYEVGRLIARRGWVVVTGGLSGVMEHASRGAADEGGMTVGILPSFDRAGMNPHVRIPIVTAMGHARNVIIAHTADALISIGGAYGTVSEMAIGLKLGKAVICVDPLVHLPGAASACSPEEAVRMAAQALGYDS